jgi:hypothetical protein
MSAQSQLALAILITLMLGCGESVGPDDAPGSYVLRRVDGDPLPAVLYDNEIYAVRVISDTIRLRADGTGTISGIRDALPLHEGLPAEGPVHASTNIRFKALVKRIEIEYECPPNANCLPPPHLIAHLRSDGLTARWGPGMLGRSPLFYSQVQAAP